VSNSCADQIEREATKDPSHRFASLQQPTGQLPLPCDHKAALWLLAANTAAVTRARHTQATRVSRSSRRRATLELSIVWNLTSAGADDRRGARSHELRDVRVREMLLQAIVNLSRLRRGRPPLPDNAGADPAHYAITQARHWSLTGVG
jgi:hypothetical protein